MEVDGSLHGSRWECASIYFHGNFHLLRLKLSPVSMEIDILLSPCVKVGLRPCTSMETPTPSPSMEIDHMQLTMWKPMVVGQTRSGCSWNSPGMWMDVCGGSYKNPVNVGGSKRKYRVGGSQKNLNGSGYGSR